MSPITRPIRAQSILCPSPLDLTSPALAPAQIVAHTQDDEVTEATASPILSQRFGGLFRSRLRSCQRYGTYERKQSYPADTRYRETPPIIRPLSPQSILDATSATLTPAQIIDQGPNTQDNGVTDVPTTGAAVSPHPRTAGSPLGPQSTCGTSLLDVTTEPLSPAGFIGHIFNAGDAAEFIGHVPNNDDGDAQNVPTAETIQTGSYAIQIQ